MAEDARNKAPMANERMEVMVIVDESQWCLSAVVMG